MITRKVVQQGTSTLVVSLPSSWAKMNDVRKGDDLIIQPNGKSLLVSTKRPEGSLKVTKDISGLHPILVKQLLARSYQKGFDEISLEFTNEAILKTIREKVQELIGYEIIEQTPTSCRIKSISSTIDLDFDNSLRRAFRICNHMINEITTAYEKFDQSVLATVHLKDLEVNRLCYYCLRQMNLQHHIDPEDTHQSHVKYYLIEALKDLGNHYKNLGSILSESNSPSPDIADLLKLMLGFATLSYEYFYDPKEHKATEAHEAYKEIEETINEFASKKTGTQAMSLHQMRAAAGILYHFITMSLDSIAAVKIGFMEKRNVCLGLSA